MKKKSTFLIMILLVIALAAVCVLGVILIMSGSDSKYEEVTNAALSYFESADYENAIIKYEEALSLDEKNEDAYEGLARTYAAKNDYVSAMHWLDMGVEKTKSPRLKKMLADYQTLLDESGFTFEYTLNDVMSNSDDVTVYNDMLTVLLSYTFGDYSEKYSFSDDSTDTSKILNEIPVVLNFADPPQADSKPISISVSDIRYLFTNYRSGISYTRLSELGTEGLAHGFNAFLNCEAVEFTFSGCHIIVECDSDGNIKKNKPKNIITFGDATPVDYAPENIANEEPTEADENENMRVFKGNIYDADTHTSAGVVHMSIFKGKQSAKGSLYKKIDTHTGGDFRIELPYGDYSIEFTASNYIKTTEEVTVKQTEDITSVDFFLNKAYSSNVIRIVLTWNESPRDIDSYLLGTASTGEKIRLWFGGKMVKSRDGNTVCTLDIDQTRGNGKETTVLYDTAGNYKFYVNNYSGEAPLSASGATVKIYEGDSTSPIYTVTLSDDFSGCIWEVCTIENGKVTVTDREATDVTSSLYYK